MRRSRHRSGCGSCLNSARGPWPSLRRRCRLDLVSSRVAVGVVGVRSSGRPQQLSGRGDEEKARRRRCTVAAAEAAGIQLDDHGLVSVAVAVPLSPAVLSPPGSPVSAVRGARIQETVPR